MSKVPLPPRRPEVVGEDYANNCAKLGELHLKQDLLVKEIATKHQDVKELFGELLRSHDMYPKESPIVKP